LKRFQGRNRCARVGAANTLLPATSTSAPACKQGFGVLQAHAAVDFDQGF
jgi:hypothetical protein